MVSPTHILFLCATESLNYEIVRFSQKITTPTGVVIFCLRLGFDNLNQQPGGLLAAFAASYGTIS